MLRLYLVQAFAFALSEPNLITFEKYKSLKILHFAWVWRIEDEELKDSAFFSVDKVIISLRFFCFSWFCFYLIETTTFREEEKKKKSKRHRFDYFQNLTRGNQHFPW